MVDGLGLGPSVKRRTGSSPVPFTTNTRLKQVLLWKGDVDQMYERSNVYDRATTPWQRRRRELYTASLLFLYLPEYSSGTENRLKICRRDCIKLAGSTPVSGTKIRSL